MTLQESIFKALKWTIYAFAMYVSVISSALLSKAFTSGHFCRIYLMNNSDGSKSIIHYTKTDLNWDTGFWTVGALLCWGGYFLFRSRWATQKYQEFNE